MSCLEGDRPLEGQVQQLRQVVENAPEPSIRPYLEECTCAFAAGAYGVAMVAGWCAVARYLKLVVETLGYDVAECFYRNEMSKGEELSKLVMRSDRPLYVVCDRMGIFDHEPSKGAIKSFYDKRNDHAHPNDRSTSADAVLESINAVRWFLQRRVSQERFPTVQTVTKCAKDPLFPWGKYQAEKLVRWLHEEQRGTLAMNLLSDLLAPDKDSLEYSKVIDLWVAVKPWLTDSSRWTLMKDLAEGLSSSQSDGFNAMDVAQHFIFWNEAVGHSAIWEFLVSQRGDLSDRIKYQVRRFASSPYRQQIDQPVEFEEDEI